MVIILGIGNESDHQGWSNHKNDLREDSKYVQYSYIWSLLWMSEIRTNSLPWIWSHVYQSH